MSSVLSQSSTSASGYETNSQGLTDVALPSASLLVLCYFSVL